MTMPMKLANKQYFHVVVFIALIVFTVQFKMVKILNNADKTLVCNIRIILCSASTVMLHKLALRFEPQIQDVFDRSKEGFQTAPPCEIVYYNVQKPSVSLWMKL